MAMVMAMVAMAMAMVAVAATCLTGAGRDDSQRKFDLSLSCSHLAGRGVSRNETMTERQPTTSQDEFALGFVRSGHERIVENRRSWNRETNM